MDDDDAFENDIVLDSYADRRKGRGITDKGFQSRFNKLLKKDKILLYLPIKGPNTKVEEWEKFYLSTRKGRTDNERKTKLKRHAFYQFLKKEPKNEQSNLYYYAIPKGFTQTDKINEEANFSYMIGTGGTLYNFRTEQKLSKKVGLCTLSKQT